MATAFCRVGRRVGQEIVLALFLGDLLQSSQKIVTVDKDESTGSVGKLEIVGMMPWPLLYGALGATIVITRGRR
jgi:hypothetical protein